jgi:hypothetical protein
MAKRFQIETYEPNWEEDIETNEDGAIRVNDVLKFNDKSNPFFQNFPAMKEISDQVKSESNFNETVDNIDFKRIVPNKNNTNKSLMEGYAQEPIDLNKIQLEETSQDKTSTPFSSSPDIEKALFKPKPSVRPIMTADFEPFKTEQINLVPEDNSVKPIVGISELEAQSMLADQKQGRRENFSDIASAIAIGSGGFADNIAGMFGKRTNNAETAMDVRNANLARREAVLNRESELSKQNTINQMKYTEHQDDLLVEGAKLDQEWQIAKLKEGTTEVERDNAIGKMFDNISALHDDIGTRIVDKYPSAKIILDANKHIVIQYPSQEVAAKIRQEIDDEVQALISKQKYSATYLKGFADYQVAYMSLSDADVSDADTKKSKEQASIYDTP